MTRPQIGFVLGSSLDPVALPAVARQIEASGFDSVWCSEDYFLAGGIAGAAIVLGATERIHVGTGVLSSFARHPALTAMEAGTLAAAHPGRFRLGLGSGVFDWLDQQGIPHARPLTATRANLETVRPLLAGDAVSGDFGGFHFDAVQLGFPPALPPSIYVGATGPKMTALAGELADGLLLSILSPAEFVTVERDLMDAASAGAAAKPISTFAMFALADDVESARAIARPIVAEYLAFADVAVMTDPLGITEELRRLRAEGVEALTKTMPDSWIDSLTICGDVDACLARIDRLAAAGCDEIALAPITARNLTHDIDALGAALRSA